MHKRHINYPQEMNETSFKFGGLPLNEENEWIKLAKLIPWDKIDKLYAEPLVSKVDQSACPARMVIGSLIIKERYHFSDEVTVDNITMNPYLQYFIGLKDFVRALPFDPSVLTRFRKQITPEMLKEINNVLGGISIPSRRPLRLKCKQDDNDDVNVGNTTIDVRMEPHGGK